jgi:excisionase family DNA binding protein
MRQTTQAHSTVEAMAAGHAVAYSITATCKLTGLGRTTIYASIKTGKLVARKVGRRTIVLYDDIKAFLEALPNA